MASMSAFALNSIMALEAQLNDPSLSSEDRAHAQRQLGRLREQAQAQANMPDQDREALRERLRKTVEAIKVVG